MPARVKKLILLLPVLIFLGCATTVPPKGRADLLDFLADGKTGKEEVIINLGQPSGRFESEKILTCRLGFEAKDKSYHVVEREAQPDGWPTWTRVNYSLVLVFDENGVLRKHSLVGVN